MFALVGLLVLQSTGVVVWRPRRRPAEAFNERLPLGFPPVAASSQQFSLAGSVNDASSAGSDHTRTVPSW